MKNILFVGDCRSNAGPANVNKELIPHLGDQYVFLQAKKSYIRMAELACKLRGSSVLVVSGVSRIGTVAMKLAKVLGVRSVYMMHGCAAYEEELNGSSEKSAVMIRRESQILENADLLLPVSARFSQWVKERYPQYAHKTQYLYNGLQKPDFQLPQEPKIPGRIVSAGGDRNSKNNAVLCQAVEGMHGEATLAVCGKIHNPAGIVPGQHTWYQDLIPQEDFYRELNRAELFVLNSVFEPFSLSVTDALNCGCSVLVSDRAGIADLLELEEADVIRDPMDAAEIQQKIQYLLQHPNQKRIASRLDYDAWSYEKQAQKLTDLCIRLTEKI